MDLSSSQIGSQSLEQTRSPQILPNRIIFEDNQHFNKDTQVRRSARSSPMPNKHIYDAVERQEKIKVEQFKANEDHTTELLNKSTYMYVYDNE
ncbi:hypothetical protein SS50377_26382 [Spironucleus salmonicida]|uniref:Uncharacterized protein n=1 Tax=Spironucleus salmonicida TaxID=348837 RepID=V6LVM9_9EUKA|nr:hypothetical protein SS50377_26382 [Spironucleus salmonicida]|eukprot:EST47751.1 Hypothetical protein SS50377_12150 [Spironucleus salmonicida]